MMNLIASFLQFSCKTAKEGISIFPHVQATPTDDGIIFPLNRNDKTGLYILKLKDTTVTEILPPYPGIIANPTLSSKMDKLFLSYAKKENGVYNEFIASFNLQDSTFTQLKAINQIAIDIVPSEDPNKLYLFLANEIDKSSPLSTYRAKSVNLYSYSIAENTINLEVRLNAYTVSGKGFMDATGENLFMNIAFGEKDSRSKPSGPYKINMKSKTLTYLVPNNIADLHPNVDMRGITKEFYTATLQPMPSKQANIYFLEGVYDVYEVNEKDGLAKIIFKQSVHDRFDRHFTLKGIANFKNTNDIIIVRKSQNGDQFVILSSEANDRIYPINMDSLINNF
jgi:hypothetical protein